MCWASCEPLLPQAGIQKCLRTHLLRQWLGSQHLCGGKSFAFCCSMLMNVQLHTLCMAMCHLGICIVITTNPMFSFVSWQDWTWQQDERLWRALEDDHRYNGQSPQPVLFQRDLPGLREGDFFFAQLPPRSSLSLWLGRIAPCCQQFLIDYKCCPLPPPVKMGKRYGGYLRLHGLLWFEVVQDRRAQHGLTQSSFQPCTGANGAAL